MKFLYNVINLNIIYYILFVITRKFLFRMFFNVTILKFINIIIYEYIIYIKTLLITKSIKII